MPPRTKPKVQLALDAYFTPTAPGSSKAQSSQPPAPRLAKRKDFPDRSDNEWTPQKKSVKTARKERDKTSPQPRRSGKEDVVEKSVDMDDPGGSARKQVRGHATATHFGLPTPHPPTAMPQPLSTGSDPRRTYNSKDLLSHTELPSKARTKELPNTITTPAATGLQSPKATGPRRRRSNAGEVSATVPLTPPRGQTNPSPSRPGSTPMSQRIVPSSQQSDHDIHIPSSSAHGVDELDNPFLARELEKRQEYDLSLAPLSSPLTRSSRCDSIAPLVSGPGFKVPPLPLFAVAPFTSPRKSSQSVPSSQSQIVLAGPSPKRKGRPSVEGSPSRERGDHGSQAVPSSQSQEIDILAIQGFVRPQEDSGSSSRSAWLPDGYECTSVHTDSRAK
ncbi:hypothetical protein OF83DRAFT_1084582 [Amylostereum chailletii]|nr:hypothetical protein OF83DRAFT_1084582 [Amylostereum chailletii]